jgi:serine/threonine protein kinase
LFYSNLNTIFESNDISIKYIELADIYLLDGKTFQFIQAQRLKLIDFVSAKFIKDYACSVTGESMFCAPEIIQGKGYSSSCDFGQLEFAGMFCYIINIPLKN